MTIDPAVLDQKVVVYEDIRDQLRPGDIMLCSGIGIVAEAIQAATGSPFSHVGLIIPLTDIDRVMLLECLEPWGVRCIAFSRYMNSFEGTGRPYIGKMIVARHRRAAVALAEPGALRDLTQRLIDECSTPYSGLAIGDIVLRIAHLPGLTRARGPHSSLICSFLVGDAFAGRGIDLHAESFGLRTPGSIAADEELDAVARLL